MDIEIEVADSYLKKLRGLMFRREFDHGLLISFNREKRFGAGIHSLFVFFRFDAVFLDSDMNVVDIRKNVKPFNPLIIPKKPSKYVLELPAGKVDEKKIVKGDELNL